MFKDSIRHLILLSSIVVMGLTACAQPKVVASDPADVKEQNAQPALGEKCEYAKNELDKAVEGGQTSELRELKRNIELHCVWRRD